MQALFREQHHLLWQDHGKTLRDLVIEAKQMGFLITMKIFTRLLIQTRCGGLCGTMRFLSRLNGKSPGMVRVRNNKCMLRRICLPIHEGRVQAVESGCTLPFLSQIRHLLFPELPYIDYL